MVYKPEVAADLFSLQLYIWEFPGLNFCPENGYLFEIFRSIPLSRLRDSVLNKATNSSFRIVSNLLIITLSNKIHWENDFTETTESGGHYIARLNVGLPDGTCYATFKNVYSLLNNTHNFCT
jgi:hypothetical protein